MGIIAGLFAGLFESPACPGSSCAVCDEHLSLVPQPAHRPPSKSIPALQASTWQLPDLEEGARPEVLASGKRGAVMLLEQGGFRALLPVWISREDLEALEYGRDLEHPTVLLLADVGYALTNRLVGSRVFGRAWTPATSTAGFTLQRMWS